MIDLGQCTRVRTIEGNQSPVEAGKTLFVVSSISQTSARRGAHAWAVLGVEGVICVNLKSNMKYEWLRDPESS